MNTNKYSYTTLDNNYYNNSKYQDIYNIYASYGLILLLIIILIPITILLIFITNTIEQTKLLKQLVRLQEYQNSMIEEFAIKEK